MTLIPFLAIAFGAAAAALIVRRYRRLSLAIGLLGLFAATIAALAIVPGDRLAVGPGRLETTEFGRLFLALGCSTGLIMVVVGLATVYQRNLPSALLGGFGALGLALSIGDSIIALVAILAGALVGSLVTLTRPVTAGNVQVASREFRAIAVAGAMALVGMAWIARPLGALAEEPTVFGLAYLAVALAAAIRFGEIPFHRWAARLSDSAPEIALPLLLAWAPAGFAVVALAWMDRSIAPLLLPLEVERAVVLAVGVLSITLGAVGAWLQDDLEHVVGYSIVQDAGFVMLGLAVLDPSAWQPTRTWILIFVVVKTAFAAWAVAARTRYRTRSIPDLGGWGRRSPVLAISFGLIVLATIGLPGLASWDVRARLIDLSISNGPMRWIVTLGGLASLVYYGRIALAGARPPSARVLAGATELPQRPDPAAVAATGTVATSPDMLGRGLGRPERESRCGPRPAGDRRRRGTGPGRLDREPGADRLGRGSGPRPDRPGDGRRRARRDVRRGGPGSRAGGPDRDVRPRRDRATVAQPGDVARAVRDAGHLGQPGRVDQPCSVEWTEWRGLNGADRRSRARRAPKDRRPSHRPAANRRPGHRARRHRPAEPVAVVDARPKFSESPSRPSGPARRRPSARRAISPRGPAPSDRCRARSRRARPAGTTGRARPRPSPVRPRRG